MPKEILVAKGTQYLSVVPKMSNRHGLIAGATGTGKTVTLQTMAEGFSRIGVPVFMADVKGDLAGISQSGGNNPNVVERAKKLGLPLMPQAMPVVFWDVFGQQGHPVRATISEMGPLLLARMLGLNDTQEGVLTLVFKIADDQGLLLLDMKDLRAILQHVGDNAGDFQTEYGHISAASIGAIQRNLLALEQQGGDSLFGEPALDLADLIQTDARGNGVVNILAADRLMAAPQVYATLLLWLLSELFEQLPEVGDPPKPKLVFFFDEAHLLFSDCPKPLLDKIEQVVRLVRSKGVGIYFVTQNPLDVSDAVLGQLGNRAQHTLRAFTPRDQKAVKAAADTFRPNPKLNTAEVITQLAVGEALISFLDESGTPAPVERGFVVPPSSRVGAITPQERQQVIQSSVLFGHYEKSVDRESAYERLKGRAQTAPTRQAQPAPSGPVPQYSQPSPSQSGWEVAVGSVLGALGRSGRRQGLAEAMAKSAARAIGSQVGRQIVRGVLGGILGGRSRY
ncbi:MAG TPA: helicase HerA-like domain-containing protein [Candidatus Sulfotelmatobacter sp.]|nr:helicase HerA-like domain-containing protein [Candidatus Sulfotelmatobacter sp.]